MTATPGTRRPRLEIASWIAAIVGALIAGYAFWSSGSGQTVAPPKAQNVKAVSTRSSTPVRDKVTPPAIAHVRFSSIQAAQGPDNQTYVRYFGARLFSDDSGNMQFLAYGCEYDIGKEVSLPVGQELPDTPEVLLAFYALNMAKAFEQGGGVVDFQVYLVNGRSVGAEYLRPQGFSCSDPATLTLMRTDRILAALSTERADGSASSELFVMKEN